ncbi:MAG: hypothetical protein F4066_03605 [Chloroflexi bacterium]|nr:hypothetical protein [Chloroflexota bacterium]MYI03927.1 hypothetical protein [Chloroflexota bacterium]
MLDTPNTSSPEDEHAGQLYTITAGGFSATCDAFASDPEQNQLWFCSMVGAQTSLKAIWAALLNSPPSPAFLIKGAVDELHEGGYERCQIPETSIGTWKTKIARLPQAGAFHAMVYTQMAELSFERDAFLLLTPDAREAPALHLRFLNQRTELPIHRSWAGWLWEQGLENEAVRPLKSAGLQAWYCHHDPQQLETELSAAVRYGALRLPRQLNGAAA